MTNHVHLLSTPQTDSADGQSIKRFGQRYVQYVNRTYRRSGTLWEERLRSCLTREEVYVLSCCRYIELNPVRSNLVARPAEYRWSSYRTNAQGEVSPFVVPIAQYESSGTDAHPRKSAYRGLFRYHVEPGIVDDIRAATYGNDALGSFASRCKCAMFSDDEQRHENPVDPGSEKRLLRQACTGKISKLWSHSCPT